jgi:hypothetical protein
MTLGACRQFDIAPPIARRPDRTYKPGARHVDIVLAENLHNRARTIDPAYRGCTSDVGTIGQPRSLATISIGSRLVDTFRASKNALN